MSVDFVYMHLQKYGSAFPFILLKLDVTCKLLD